MHVQVTGLTCDESRLFDCLERVSAGAQQVVVLVLVALAPATRTPCTEAPHLTPMYPVLPQQSTCLVQPNMPENRACLQAKRQSHPLTSWAAAHCGVVSSALIKSLAMQPALQ